MTHHVTNFSNKPANSAGKHYTVNWIKLAAAIAIALLAACGGESEPDAVAEAGSLDNESAQRAFRAGANGTSSRLSSEANIPITRIVLSAASTQASGTGALLQLRYNGAVIAAGEVRSDSVTDLVFSVARQIDGGMLDIVFSNAETADGAPLRLLTLSGITINGTALTTTGAGVTYDLGHGLDAFDGEALRPGSAAMVSTGALRIPLPAAARIGVSSIGSSALLSPGPGPYVDLNNGSDANPGTFDRPFKTLARLQRLAGVPLMTGENIHLRCSSLWHESLLLGTTQLTTGTQIVPYGSECSSTRRPIISGADLFNGGWTKSGAVWSRSLPAATPKIARLLINGVAMRTAQFPNAGQPTALVRAAVPGNPNRFLVADTEIAALTGRDLRGAVLMLRTQSWLIEPLELATTQSSSSEISLSSSPKYAVEAGDGWTLQGKHWMLDAAGEFFHDPVAQRLYVVASPEHAALDVNLANVEASVRDFVVDLRERSGLVVRGIDVRLARRDGVRLTDAPEAQVIDVQSRENGLAGIRLYQWLPLSSAVVGPLVQGNTVAGNGEYGIDATYVEGARILNNRVLDTGTGAYAGPVVAAIAGGPASRIEGNTVDGAGYVGIQFGGRLGNVISSNEISRYCLRLSDCGGIYSWSGSSGAGVQLATLIEGNRIFDAVAATEGSDAWGSDVVAGIYLDDLSQRVTVRSNFVQGTPLGIFLHNASFNTVSGNQVWLARRCGLCVWMDRTDGDWSTNNVLTGNEIVPMTTASAVWPAQPSFTISHPIAFTHALAGQAALGAGRNEFSATRVVQMHGTSLEHAEIAGPSGQRFVDAAGWRLLNPGENVPEQPMSFSTHYLALGPEKVPGGQFDGGLGAWGKHWNWRITGYAAQGVPAQPGCTGPCARMTVAEGGDMIFSPGFSMRPGVPHVYRWTAVAGSTAATVSQPYIGRNGTPWDTMNDARGFTSLSSRDVAAGQTRQYEAFFVPKSSDAASIYMQLETLNVPVHIDAVSVREVLGYVFSGRLEWSAPVVAPKDSARTINACGDVGWPADCVMAHLNGTPVSLPLTVAAGRQELLLWANSPYRR